MPQTEHVRQSPFISTSGHDLIEYPSYQHESPPNEYDDSGIRISKIFPVAQFIFKVMGIFGLGAIIGYLIKNILLIL